MKKKTILTGIRPTGNMHLGHYFGTVQSWKELQNDYDMYIEIADVQALTDNFNDPTKVSENIREIAIDILSTGVNPDKITLFIQSMIPEIAELTVYYSNFVTMARLYRNPTVKNEIQQKKKIFGNDGESVTYGFVGYPVSQAADITLFNGELVPVGEDQLPLLEQCREIVRKFNSIYGDALIEPQAILGKTTRIKGLDGNEKMGKSLNNAIYLSDDENEISKKIMNAITDPNKIRKDDPANPEVCMVYYYHNLVNKDNINTVCGECKSGTRGCVACKKELIENMNRFLEPIRKKRNYYLENPDVLNEILINGTKNASLIAKNNMKNIRRKMEINYFDK